MSMIDHSESVIIHGGTFTQHVASSLSQAFEQLTKAVAPGAFHNSGERFDPPKCHPRTRLAVTDRIMSWILGEENTNDHIMWMHGPAGAGKSAIAQRIAELCHEANRLLASFFFSKSDSRRNRADLLFPTIAYQIACAFPGARALIEQEIARDPLIFTRSLEAQMVGLIVNPLQPLIDSDFFADPTSSPRLILLDGLDEVLDRQGQRRILETISNVLRRNHIPLIFLIASRPEQEISYAFNSRPLAELTARLVLDDTFHPDEDIRVFLDDSFSEIKESHPRKHSIPASWPSSDFMDQLVYKSSGQFIYASTVIRFIKSIRHKPVDQLDIILGLRPVHRDLPFSELDALYMHILSALQYPDQTLQIIGAILSMEDDWVSTVYPISSTPGMEQFLGLELGDVDLYLADMTSLVSWDPEGTEPICILHASFGDFLFDSSRSGTFTIDRKALQTMMTCHCLRHLISASKNNLPEEYWKDQFSYYAIHSVAVHLSRSFPSPDLMDYLQKLSFEHLIGSMHIHLSTLLQQSPAPISREHWEINYFPKIVWEHIFEFVTAMQALGLDQSEYHNLRRQLFDQVLKKGLESHHSRNSSLQFLLCLRVRSDSDIHSFSAISRWNAAACQLTDWNIPVSPPQKMLFNNAILPWSGPYTSFPSHSETTVLREFLQDASRAGRYVVDADAYASASLSCLKYLSRFRLGAPINIHHTRRNLARRRNSPWHWRQHMKLISGQPIQDNFWYDGVSKRGLGYYSLKYPAVDEDRENLWHKFRHLRERAERRQMYLDSTYLGLEFLCRALPRSAKSDELVAFLNAEKPFSQRTLQFPAKLKEAKAAIATYLARVQQPSGEELSMVEA